MKPIFIQCSDDMYEASEEFFNTLDIANYNIVDNERLMNEHTPLFLFLNASYRSSEIYIERRVCLRSTAKKLVYKNYPSYELTKYSFGSWFIMKNADDLEVYKDRLDSLYRLRALTGGKKKEYLQQYMDFMETKLEEFPVLVNASVLYIKSNNEPSPYNDTINYPKLFYITLDQAKELVYYNKNEKKNNKGLNSWVGELTLKMNGEPKWGIATPNTQLMVNKIKTPSIGQFHIDDSGSLLQKKEVFEVMMDEIGEAEPHRSIPTPQFTVTRDLSAMENRLDRASVPEPLVFSHREEYPEDDEYECEICGDRGYDEPCEDCKEREDRRQAIITTKRKLQKKMTQMGRLYRGKSSTSLTLNQPMIVNTSAAISTNGRHSLT